MRQHVVTVLAATIAAISISFAVAQATSPTAQSSATTDRKILQELKKLNSNVASSNTELKAIRRATGDSPFGSSSTVLGLLHDICGNTNTASPSGTCY